jgi:hypothetical protein
MRHKRLDFKKGEGVCAHGEVYYFKTASPDGYAICHKDAWWVTWSDRATRDTFRVWQVDSPTVIIHGCSVYPVPDKLKGKLCIQTEPTTKHDAMWQPTR